MTDTLAGVGWNISHSKMIDGELYRVHTDGRNRPYGYWSEKQADNAAKRLRSLGWSARVVYHTARSNPGAHPYIIYKRKK